MAEKKLSPRQRMINMMYLVLTALLALNVSKEVLQSFFTVNTGIVRSTANFDSKNNELYQNFEEAAANDPVKFKNVRDKAFEIKKSSDRLNEVVQQMKYELVLAVDKKVALGKTRDLINEDGKLMDEVTITTPWNELSSSDKTKSIGWLTNKKDRNKSGELFLNPPKETANKLKLDLVAYRDLLVELSEGNITLEKNLNDVFDIEREDFGKKQNQTWEQYNFQDMPAVGALTILSKIQADIRNMESDVVSYLRTSLGKNDLKFDAGGEAVVSASNLVFLNDTFRAEIFLAPKNSQNPEIYIGEYDELSDGTYEMRGDYETIKVRNGKGYYATRATSEGSKEYGGLIVMKTESGDKKFPFKKDYKVAKVEGIVSIDLMNKVFQGIDNPITVSVPGYTADQIDVRCTDCQYPPKKINIKTGQWEINPKTLTNKAKPLVRLFVKSDDGGWKPMGEKLLRVVPAGTPTITFGLKGKGKGTRADIITKGIFANSSDRDLRSKLKYEIKGYSWKKGGAKQYTIVELDQKGPVKWDAKFKKAVESSQIGQSLIIKDVIYRQKCPTCKPIKIEDQKYVIEIE